VLEKVLNKDSTVFVLLLFLALATGTALNIYRLGHAADLWQVLFGTTYLNQDYQGIAYDVDDWMCPEEWWGRPVEKCWVFVKSPYEDICVGYYDKNYEFHEVARGEKNKWVPSSGFYIKPGERVVILDYERCTRTALGHVQYYLYYGTTTTTTTIPSQCTEGWTDDYRCYGDMVQRKWRNEDCTYEWRNYKNCNNMDGFYGERYCVGRSVYQKYRDYYCSNGKCKYYEDERRVERCDYKCENGRCVEPTCEDECDYVGQTKCENSYKYTCGNYDDDECLEWGNQEYCRFGCNEEGTDCKVVPPPSPPIEVILQIIKDLVNYFINTLLGPVYKIQPVGGFRVVG